MKSDLIQHIKKLASDNLPEIISIRRHIHQNPELSFQEFNTSEFIQSKLTEFGIEFKSGFVKTGIVAFVKGKNPDKKIIALRSDMDALPILEENEVEYKSKNEGVMHACGHDVHSSCLLGIARILNDLKDEFEEKFPPGTKAYLPTLKREGVVQGKVNKQGYRLPHCLFHVSGI